MGRSIFPVSHHFVPGRGFLGYSDRDISGVLENIVYLELLHRGYDVSIGKLNDRAVDFIADRHNERVYIQACLTLESAETQEREFSVLEQVKDNHPKLVVSLDEYQQLSRSGIQHQNLRTWLLEGPQ